MPQSAPTSAARSATLPRSRRSSSANPVQKTAKTFDPVDVHVGARIRHRRTLCGLSQQDLGKAIGLTFQQVQKYERGSNRVGSSRLQQIADALEVHPGWFFDSNDNPAGGEQPTIGREELELIRAYRALPNAVRKNIRDLIRATARAMPKVSS